MSAIVKAVDISGADEAVASGRTYHGFSLKETSGAASATVKIYRGSDATGDLVEVVQLAASESAREFYPGGISVSFGIYIDIVSGSVEGSVRVSS